MAVTIVANAPPVADAGGREMTENEGGPVRLDGSLSADPDGDTLAYAWAQRAGDPPVTLDDPNAVAPTFTAPYVGSGGETLRFTLTVSDNDPVNPLSDDADVDVHVQNANDPPNCAAATASTEFLWPPDRSLSEVSIGNIADPNASDTTRLLIRRVTQDEPTSGLDPDDATPDAVIQRSRTTDRVLLRNERAEDGNGRVYKVWLRATDGRESCDGFVRVKVRHARSEPPVNDGQRYLSATRRDTPAATTSRQSASARD